MILCVCVPFEKERQKIKKKKQLFSIHSVHVCTLTQAFVLHSDTVIDIKEHCAEK